MSFHASPNSVCLTACRSAASGTHCRFNWPVLSAARRLQRPVSQRGSLSTDDDQLLPTFRGVLALDRMNQYGVAKRDSQLVPILSDGAKRKDPEHDQAAFSALPGHLVEPHLSIGTRCPTKCRSQQRFDIAGSHPSCEFRDFGVRKGTTLKHNRCRERQRTAIEN